jgi:large subunit ribosomal protein L9
MATATKVLLQADVENLGSGGEIVKVRPGFARNFLLPRGLAVPATAGNLARVEDLKKAAAARKAVEVAGAQELAKKLEGSSVKIARAAGDEGKMFGSVTSKDIGDAFEKIGVTIDRKQIQLAEPIKTLGAFDVPLKLHGSVTVTLKVTVEKADAKK